MNTGKKWSIGFLILTTVFLTVIGSFTAVVDPFFHYHAPREGLSYPIGHERYQNDGIVKHFTYDAMITGTSMTENFRPSELDALFGVRSIKVPFSGSTFREVDENLRRAIAANPELKMVIRCLDGYMLTQDKDAMRTDAAFPEYLYDENLFNDVEYLFNKSILFDWTMDVLDYTAQGKQTTTFDEYMNWNNESGFGHQRVLEQFPVVMRIDYGNIEQPSLDPETETRLRENMAQNVVAVVEENPDIQFYFYFPPYSIVWWSGNYASGTLLKQIECYRIASEMLLQYSNVRLFSFSADQNVILDLNNYRDLEHHSQEINSKILVDMHEGSFELTQEKNISYWDSVFSFFNTFDYKTYYAPYMVLEENSAGNE